MSTLNILIDSHKEILTRYIAESIESDASDELKAELELSTQSIATEIANNKLLALILELRKLGFF